MKPQTKGSLFIALSALFFGSYGVWSRLIENSADTFFQVWVRSLIILCILIPLSMLNHSLKRIDKQDIKWILIYTICGSFTVAPIFYAFNALGIGPATLLFYAAFTIVSYILCVLSFGEKLTIIKVASLLLSLLGLYFVFDFSLHDNSLYPAIAALFAGAAAGGEVTYTKRVSDKYSTLQLSVFMWGMLFITHLVISLMLGERLLLPAWSVTWLGILGYSITSLCAFALVVMGFKYVEPSIGAVIGLLEIIFGILFGILLFNEQLTASISIGTALIFIAAALPNVWPTKRVI